MENPITYKKFITTILLMAISVFGILSAQTTHEVSVSNFKFSPANLVIPVGDIVRWTNAEGIHDVDGTKATNPSNPISFGNSSGDAGWVYAFTFATEGVYNYRCSVHGASMSGKITVGNVTGIQDNTAENSPIKAFPNPVSDMLYIAQQGKPNLENKNLTLLIYNLIGQSFTRIVYFKDEELSVNVKDLSNGLYMFKLSDREKIIGFGNFVKN